MQKIYINGCSFIKGVGVDYADSVPGLFAASGKHSVTDRSRGGQSNMAIAMDLQKHLDDHDVYVIGWTFADRMYINYNDVHLDFSPMNSPAPTDKFEQSNIKDLGKLYYSLYDHSFHSETSNMLIDNACARLLANGKKVVFLTWEERDVDCPIYRYAIKPEYMLADGHINEEGLRQLYYKINEIIDEQE